MKSITLGKDGKYRWRYEMSLFKNPTVFLLVWKILFFAALCIFTVVFISDACQPSSYRGELMLDSLKFFGYFLLGMTAVTVLGYVIYAAIMGGKYIVDFEMDERGVWHRQAPDQAKKARKIGAITSALGAASGRPSTAAAGINATRTEKYSEFDKVKSVKAYPRRNIIKVNAPFNKNQVYVCKEDFDFVLDYIKQHTGK